MTRLVFTPPDRNAPGFLRRNIQALELQKRLQREQSPDALMDMARFLAQFVQADDTDDALDLLLDASQADFEAMVAAIGGGGADPN